MLKLVYPLILVISLLVISVYPAKIPNEDEGRVHHDHVKNFIKPMLIHLIRVYKSKYIFSYIKYKEIERSRSLCRH